MGGRVSAIATLPQRKLRRRRLAKPGPAGAVHRRHDPLGHDAAADDARQPSGARDPAGDPLRSRADQDSRDGDPKAGDDRDRRSLRTGDLGDFGLSRRRARRCAARHRADRATPACAAARLLRPLRRHQGKKRWGDKTPGYMLPDEADRRRPAGGAVHPPDPRRPRRRALLPAQGSRPGGRQADRRPLAKAGQAGRAPGQEGQPLHGASLRGPRHAIPRPSCAGSASSSSSTSGPRCSTTTSAPTSGWRRSTGR